MKNLLVPTDFSPEAHHAYEVALQLARHTGGSVTLLHVLEDLDEASGGISTLGGSLGGPGIEAIYPIKLMEATKRRLLALMAEAAPLAGNVPVREVIKTGPIGAGILKAVERHHIDLVVMGARGHGAMEHFFVSSNTERMIRLAPCPVLSVKHRQVPYAVRTMVFPSDFSAEAAQAIEPLHEALAAFPEAKLHLLHVLGDRDAFAARQRMEAFAQLAQLPPCEMSEVNASRTATGIEQYAEQVKADLVVIPTHARSGLSSFFHTSIAEAVATHAFPPVLTYHFRSVEPAAEPSLAAEYAYPMFV
ncbi:universal stress protein [Hymenobacter sp. 5317J-9]|uniref:universal stress protein n=1 Tax=Hymenobacter sp. 5317J-9 TaxID=2932250 RepID=UPI001FD664B1|nr:universal stress protein [Hymenobacter sp. 5317J-9]UOQ96551.1 universal stress protein [Hymenobacter sp. 5317J-9]